MLDKEGLRLTVLLRPVGIEKGKVELAVPKERGAGLAQGVDELAADDRPEAVDVAVVEEFGEALLEVRAGRRRRKIRL